MCQHDVVDSSGQPRANCPDWCVTDHEACTGEENWVHMSAPLYFTSDLAARLCFSADAESGTADGPHVLIGDTEYSPSAAQALGTALIELAARCP
jgi:hypothetical protein